MNKTPPGSKKSSSLFLPEEQLILFAAFLTTTLYLFFGLSNKNALSFYLDQLLTLAYLIPLALLFAFLFLVFELGFQERREGRALSEALLWSVFRREYLNWRSLALRMRSLNAIMLLFVIFAHLKHLIPLVNPRLYDAQLLDWERRWFGGELLAQKLFSVFGSEAAEFFSFGYQSYYAYLSLVVMVLVFQRDQKLRHEFCSAFVLLWLLGIGMIYLLPTYGPCFFVPEIFAGLPETRMTIMQADLWSMKLELDSNPWASNALFAISGLPSLHFAVVLLGTWYSLLLSRALFLVSLFCLLMTFLSTIYFGWHYLLDDLASIALVLASVFFARKLVRTL